MGKLIVCNSPIAEQPYCFRMTQTNVYSIEEVCYYIRHNIYMMQEEVFDQDFVIWIREQLHMEQLADKMDMMRQDHDNLKDMVVTLCCSCDYYDEVQINDLINIMDETSNLPLRGRQKIKADSYLKSGRLKLARKEYESILQSDDMLHGTEEEYGELYHSMGVSYAQMGEFDEAAEAFRKAYEYNQRMESLQSHLFSIRLSNKDGQYIQALNSFDVTPEQIKFLEAQYTQAQQIAQNSRGYRQTMRIQELEKSGHQVEYQTRLKEVIRQWKKEYRQYESF